MATIHVIEGNQEETEFYACMLSYLLMQTQPVTIFNVCLDSSLFRKSKLNFYHLANRYNLTITGVKNRAKKIGIKPEYEGSSPYVNQQQLRCMDALNEHCLRGGNGSNFRPPTLFLEDVAAETSSFDFTLQTLYPKQSHVLSLKSPDDFDHIWDTAAAGATTLVYLNRDCTELWSQWLVMSGLLWEECEQKQDSPVQFVHWFDCTVPPDHYNSDESADDPYLSGLQIYYAIHKFNRICADLNGRLPQIFLTTMAFQEQINAVRTLHFVKRKEALFAHLQRSEIEWIQLPELSHMEYKSIPWQTQRLNRILESAPVKAQTSIASRRMIQTIQRIQKAFQECSVLQAVDVKQPFDAPGQHDAITLPALPEQAAVLNGAGR